MPTYFDAMSQFRIFISSVQSEFSEERIRLKAYIENSPFLRRFFSVFVFESDIPPQDKRADEVYLEVLSECNVYLALVGDFYAGSDTVLISPTEREYDEATRLGLRRIVLVKSDSSQRDDRERKFLDKISGALTWHEFSDSQALLNWTLAALDKVMCEEDLYRMLPFDIDPFEFGIVIKRRIVDAVNPPVNPPVMTIDQLPAKYSDLVDYLAKNPHATYDDMSRYIKKNRDTVRKYLRVLRDSYTVIRRVGSDKAGHWEVLI